MSVFAAPSFRLDEERPGPEIERASANFAVGSQIERCAFRDSPHGIYDCEQAPCPDDDLASSRGPGGARMLSARLFKNAKRMPQYKNVLAQPEGAGPFSREQHAAGT